MRRKAPAGWPIALLLALGGCSGDKLYIGSDTVLGIAIGYNTAREAARVDIGYDRHFVTWIPRSVAEADDGGSKVKEAMSVLGCTNLQIGNLSLQGFEESLATGVAARTFAKKINESNYFRCFASQQGGGS